MTFESQMRQIAKERGLSLMTVLDSLFRVGRVVFDGDGAIVPAPDAVASGHLQPGSIRKIEDDDGSVWTLPNGL